MIIIWECAGPMQWKPGKFQSILGGKGFTRVWWGFFSVSFWHGDLHEYGIAVRDGEWRNQ